MSYVEDITEPLIKTLAYASGLPIRQLAGHAANLEFWVGEVEHAFAVIDGYGERFKRLQAGERSADASMGIEWHPFHERKLLRPGLRDHDLKELRSRLRDSALQMLRRCHKEALVAEETLEAFGGRLGLDPDEWKRKKGS